MMAMHVTDRENLHVRLGVVEIHCFHLPGIMVTVIPHLT